MRQRHRYWGSLGWNALIDGPGHADTAWFVHLTSSPGDQGTNYWTATRALISNAVKVTDGQPVTVSGTMLEVPSSKSIDLELPMPEYLALGAAVSPVAGPLYGYYEVLTSPAASKVGYDTGAGVVFSVNVDAKTPALRIKTSYGDPYTEAWGEIANVRLYYPVPVLVPGASAPAQVTAVVHASDLAAKLTVGKAGPFTTPVREPKVNGQPAFVEIPHATATPAITWSPPAMGKPDLYMVEVLHARVANGTATFSPAATLYTVEPRFDVPPDVLQFGESYVLRIRAVVGEGLSATNPWKWPVRIGWADCITARFSP